MSKKTERVVIPILTYQYEIYSSRYTSSYATVRLHSAKGLVAEAHFLRERDAKAPTEKDREDLYNLYYLKDELPDVIDLLRNEKPLYFINDKCNATRIATSIEPVGEGE